MGPLICTLLKINLQNKDEIDVGFCLGRKILQGRGGFRRCWMAPILSCAFRLLCREGGGNFRGEGDVSAGEIEEIRFDGRV